MLAISVPAILVMNRAVTRYCEVGLNAIVITTGTDQFGVSRFRSVPERFRSLLGRAVSLEGYRPNVWRRFGVHPCLPAWRCRGGYLLHPQRLHHDLYHPRVPPGRFASG